MVGAFFEPVGPGRYVATELTRGPWDVNAQHGGPPAALLGATLEQCPGGTKDGQVVRVTVEILRPIPLGPLEVSADVVRPGRKVEMLAAELHAGGVVVARATAWRMRTGDIGMAVGQDVRQPPPPDGIAPMSAFPWTADVGYTTAMEWRFATGEFLAAGPAAVWMRMRHPLVEGKEPTPLTRVLIAADSGSGVSAELDFSRYLFINTDLTVALHRLPLTEWVCLDAATTVEAHGIGLSESRLFDERGVLGRAVQSLYIDRR